MGDDDDDNNTNNEHVNVESIIYMRIYTKTKPESCFQHIDYHLPEISTPKKRNVANAFILDLCVVVVVVFLCASFSHSLSLMLSCVFRYIHLYIHSKFIHKKNERKKKKRNGNFIR